MGPNRRAQERERAAARAAAEAKRAEAERKAIVDAQKIVAIWNARQAGGRALWFYPTIGVDRRRRPVADVLLPRLRTVWLGRLAHARSAPRQRDLKPHPVAFVSKVFAQRSVREARNTDG
jgi:hypothetical protein